ncbi:MAG: polysaccharide biosynthesis protein, partial [Clostridia bacterium]|nr:polysaccharide biosynthesis protein [Clostridia bacterium]
METDVVIAVLSLLGTLWLSAGFNVKGIPLYTLCFIPICFILLPITEYFFKVNRISWRHAGYHDVTKLGTAVIIGVSLSLFLTFIVADGKPTFEWNGVICTLLLSLVVSSVARMLLRDLLIKQSRSRGMEKLTRNGEIADYGRSIIIGAGVAGERLLRAFFLDANFAKSEVVGIIDDDHEKHNSLIRGVNVLGGRDVIPEVVKEKNVKTIFFAIPTATGDQRRDILRICSETGCDVRILPGLDECFDLTDAVRNIRKVNICDLLGRDTVQFDVDKVCGYVKDKTVMVTGGGGSIGSELCRQLATHMPKKLIIFDIYENSAYDILNELKRNYPQLDVIALIGSVRDEERLNSVFEQYRPEVVYHAAAHKH